MESGSKLNCSSAAKSLGIGFLMCAMTFVGCSLGHSSRNAAAVVTTCGIPADQTGTISGQWPVIPVPIAFHQGDFDAAEISEMVAAVTTWNTFFTASKNLVTLDVGGGTRFSATADPAQSGSLCANGLVPGNSFIGNVVIYKLGTWPTTYSSSAMAITSFCVLPQKPFSRMFMATLEVNYQHFFSPGLKQPDLQSIILHELGHLLGLNHSCETRAKANTPNCGDPNLVPDYASASMFPVFNFDDRGNGEVKRALGPNDQSRANCLYPPGG